MNTTGKLYVAGPEDKAIIARVTEHFTKLLGKAIAFDVVRDDHLVGGFIAIVDGKLYDASIATKVDHMFGYLTKRG